MQLSILNFIHHPIEVAPLDVLTSMPGACAGSFASHEDCCLTVCPASRHLFLQLGAPYPVLFSSPGLPGFPFSSLLPTAVQS